MRKYFLLVGILLLSACSSTVVQETNQITDATTATVETKIPEPSFTLPVPSSTATLVIDATQVPTDTPFPTSTLASTMKDTPSPSSTQTATIAPTTFAGFEAARVYQAVDYQEETIFYFIVPYVGAPYYGFVDGHPMRCEVDISFPNTLVCRANVNLFGSDVKAFVKETLNVKASSGSDVHYRGNPNLMDVHTSSGADIIKID